LQFHNRIATSPMCQYAAEEGKAAEWHMIHPGYMALSGAGLMILEASTRALC
jgi:2,4-dienoyl-CoA reductase-like NADH-dependent reductase (Old Yellow Enzyme family)